MDGFSLSRPHSAQDTHVGTSFQGSTLCTQSLLSAIKGYTALGTSLPMQLEGPGTKVSSMAGVPQL